MGGRNHKYVKAVPGIFNFREHIRNVSFRRKKDFVISLFLFEKCHSTDEIDNIFLNFLFLYLGLNISEVGEVANELRKN